MSRVTLGALLVAVWLLMWGELSFANVLSGVVVVVLLFLVFPSDRAIWPHRRVHLLSLAHLGAYFVVELLMANVSVAQAVLGPRRSIRSAVLTVPLCVDDPALITLISTMTALTPGSLIVEAGLDPAHVRVHSFGHGDPVRVAATVRRLEELSIRALGDSAHRYALECRLPLTDDDLAVDLDVDQEDLP
ncbi:MAG: Na+/H+ antiporter subunit E [Microthrixaceae bacterium]